LRLLRRRCCKELIIHFGLEPPVPRRQPVLRMTANKNIRTELLKTQATENVTVIVGALRSCLSPSIFRVP
jgi:hypothetical protein